MFVGTEQIILSHFSFSKMNKTQILNTKNQVTRSIERNMHGNITLASVDGNGKQSEKVKKKFANTKPCSFTEAKIIYFFSNELVFWVDKKYLSVGEPRKNGFEKAWELCKLADCTKVCVVSALPSLITSETRWALKSC
jgi:hypothetical protein